MIPGDDRRDEGQTGFEPPVLKVKREAVRDVTYHYDRAAREAMKRSRPRPRAGLFAQLFGRIFGAGRSRRRGRRSLLPVALVALALVMAARLLPRERATGHLAGYDLTLRAYPYQDALLASVDARWNPLAREDAAEAPEVTVRFSAGAARSATVVAEPLGGGAATVRGRLGAAGAGRRVSAEVAIGGKSLRLAASVGKP